MEAIRLTIPTGEYLDQVWDYRQECLDAGSHMDGCGALRQAGSPSEWLANVISYMDPAALPEGRVQTTQFLAVRESMGAAAAACSSLTGSIYDAACGCLTNVIQAGWKMEY